MAKRQTKDSPHYVNNKEFTAALKEYSAECQRCDAEDIERPIMSRYIGECIIKMSNRLALRPNFIGYPYRDEMVQDAILAGVRYAGNFKGDKFDNGFAYITQVLFSHMVQRIKKEKKKYMLDLKLIQEADQNLFLNSEFADVAGEKAKSIADQKMQDLEDQKAGKDKSGHSKGGFTLRYHKIRKDAEEAAIAAHQEEYEIDGKVFKVREEKKEEYWERMRKHNNPPE
jgi:hypothetical protein